MMMFPFQNALEMIASGISLGQLKKYAEELSLSYRSSGRKKEFDESMAIAYLLTRMPATFSAIKRVLEEIETPIASMVDLGSGPGTGAWAAQECFSFLEKIICYEREPQFLSLGKKMSEHAPFVAEWHSADIAFLEKLPKVDLALLSYSFGELSAVGQAKLFTLLSQSEIPLIVLIEPGTPKGFQTIIECRNKWILQGGYLVAPCPGTMACPLEKKESRWCHFSVRLPRSSLHRKVKGVELGYEDEKFSYLILSKEPPVKSGYKRLLSSSQKKGGRVTASLCTLEGEREVSLLKSDDDYHTLRKLKWGDKY